MEAACQRPLPVGRLAGWLSGSLPQDIPSDCTRTAGAVILRQPPHRSARVRQMRQAASRCRERAREAIVTRVPGSAPRGGVTGAAVSQTARRGRPITGKVGDGGSPCQGRFGSAGLPVRWVRESPLNRGNKDMVNRHRSKVVVGLGALLGLCTVGCEPGSLYTLPSAPGMMPTRSLMAPAPPPVQMMPPRAAGGADIPVCLDPGADRNGCPTSSGVRQVVAVSTNAPVIRPADAREVGGSIVASSWQPRSFPSRIVPQPAPVELMPPTASGSTTVMGPELQTFTPSDLK